MRKTLATLLIVCLALALVDARRKKKGPSADDVPVRGRVQLRIAPENVKECPGLAEFIPKSFSLDGMEVLFLGGPARLVFFDDDKKEQDTVEVCDLSAEQIEAVLVEHGLEF